MKSFLIIPLIALLISFAFSPAIAQISERDQAIKYYLDGNDIEAILALESILKKKEYAADAELINYLGLAYHNALDPKSRKMFEKAVKLDPNNGTYRANLAYSYLLLRQLGKSQDQAKRVLKADSANGQALFVVGTADLWERDLKGARETADKMLRLAPDFPPGYMLSADVSIAELGRSVSQGAGIRSKLELMKEAVDTLELGFRTCPPSRDRRTLVEKTEALREFYAHFSKDPDTPANPSPLDPSVTPVKILSKPQARYTGSARSAGVQGNIRVLALLGAGGHVLYALPLNSLGYGLDEQAMTAAKQISFIPKMKDGKPVSTVVTIEYSFNIY